MTTMMGMEMPGPLEMGPVILYHIKKGTMVKKVRVFLTHLNVHYIWSSTDKRSTAIRTKWPLELRLPKLGEPDEVIDCRQFTAPWDVTILPPKPPAQTNGKMDPDHAAEALQTAEGIDGRSE